MTLAYCELIAPEFETLDLSQSIGRALHRSDGLCPTLTEASIIWYKPYARTLTGKEALLLTGLPPEILNETRLNALKTALSPQVEVDSLMSHLAGNAWSGSAVLAIYIAILQQLPSNFLCHNKAGCESDTESSDVGAFAARLLAFCMFVFALHAFAL